VDIPVVLLKTKEHLRNCSRKGGAVDLDTYSTPVDLSKFNESWYLFRHLSIYQASCILIFQINFWPMMTNLSEGFVY